MNISGRTALVTGANRGLGTVFVEELVARACKVYACARNAEELSQLVRQYGEQVVPVTLDVTSQKDISAATAIANDVSFLVNNAGRLDQKSLGEAGDLSSLRGEMEVNVFGLGEMCLAFAPIIGRNGGGAIVNVLSAASLVAIPHFGSYAATKAAAMSLTHSMRWDFEAIGVDVIGIYASLIDTGMVANVNAPKTAPKDVVQRAFSGIEAGELDIAVDERSKALRAKFHNGLEEQLTAARKRANARRK